MRRTVSLTAVLTVAVPLILSDAPLAAETEDLRTPVSLPAELRASFLAHMRDHMVSFDNVMAELAASDFKAAALTARDQLVVGSGEGFGRYLPIEFREMGLAMHRAAADFAEVADAASNPPTTVDWQAAVEALQFVSSQCSACHAVFRVE